MNSSRKSGLSESRKRFRGKRQLARTSAKRPVNVALDAELLSEARRLGINLSQTLETELRRLTEEDRIVHFQKNNRSAFDSYNVYVKRNGVFGEELLDVDDSSV